VGGAVVFQLQQNSAHEFLRKDNAVFERCQNTAEQRVIEMATGEKEFR
jgi:hypothetical protein